MLQVALPDDYIEHGNVDILKKEAGIDAESIEKQDCCGVYRDALKRKVLKNGITIKVI